MSRVFAFALAIALGVTCVAVERAKPTASIAATGTKDCRITVRHTMGSNLLYLWNEQFLATLVCSSAKDFEGARILAVGNSGQGRYGGKICPLPRIRKGVMYRCRYQTLVWCVGTRELRNPVARLMIAADGREKVVALTRRNPSSLSCDWKAGDPKASLSLIGGHRAA
jgi:hypothetical protein